MFKEKTRAGGHREQADSYGTPSGQSPREKPQLGLVAEEITNYQGREITAESSFSNVAAIARQFDQAKIVLTETTNIGKELLNQAKWSYLKRQYQDTEAFIEATPSLTTSKKNALRAFVTIENMVFTHNRSSFGLYRDGLRNAFKADKNWTKMPTFTNGQYKEILRDLYAGLLTKIGEFNSGSNGPQRAKVYSVKYPQTLSYLTDINHKEQKSEAIRFAKGQLFFISDADIETDSEPVEDHVEDAYLELLEDYDDDDDFSQPPSIENSKETLAELVVNLGLPWFVIFSDSKFRSGQIPLNRFFDLNNQLFRSEFLCDLLRLNAKRQEELVDLLFNASGMKEHDNFICESISNKNANEIAVNGQTYPLIGPILTLNQIINTISKRFCDGKLDHIKSSLISRYRAIFQKCAANSKPLNNSMLNLFDRAYRSGQLEISHVMANSEFHLVFNVSEEDLSDYLLTE